MDDSCVGVGGDGVMAVPDSDGVDSGVVVDLVGSDVVDGEGGDVVDEDSGGVVDVCGVVVEVGVVVGK